MIDYRAHADDRGAEEHHVSTRLRHIHTSSKTLESTMPFQAHRHVHRYLPFVSDHQHDYEHASYISQKCMVDGVVHRCELCEIDLLTVAAMRAHCQKNVHSSAGLLDAK
jgi:hypothetical protein